MDKLRYGFIGTLFGILLGAGAAPVLQAGTETSRPAEGGAWTSYHSAIPARAEEEASPTF
jgi:hypothetical protein